VIIMKKIKMIVFIPVFLALFAGMALAAPGIPNQFWGTVTHNGQPAADGLIVTAKIDGIEVASTTTSGGTYSLIVTDPDSDRTGHTVNLFVQAINTGESDIFYNGGVTEIDLFVTYTPPQDNTPPPVTTSSGGGGGGGGYVPPATTTSSDDEENETTTTTTTPTDVDAGTPDEEECAERWVCSDWSTCEDGLQERNCVDDNDCGTDDRKPFEIQPCSLEEAQSSSPTGFAFMTALGNHSFLVIIGLLIAALIGIGFKKGLIKI